MNHRIALVWLICPFALLSLSGCGEKRPTSRPTPVIEVPVPAYGPLDASLTAPIAEPATPPAHCQLLGVPVICALDGLFQINEWQGVLDKCNADRATAARVSAGVPPATVEQHLERRH
jgi:hypothetical protein